MYEENEKVSKARNFEEKKKKQIDVLGLKDSIGSRKSSLENTKRGPGGMA